MFIHCSVSLGEFLLKSSSSVTTKAIARTLMGGGGGGGGGVYSSILRTTSFFDQFKFPYYKVLATAFVKIRRLLRHSLRLPKRKWAQGL